MNTMSGWEAQTRELLERVRRDKELIQSEAQKRMAALEQREWALEETLRAYQEMIGTDLRQTSQELNLKDFDGKTYREILQLIASLNDGLLIARYAITLMKKANVFGNPENADSAVYSVLNRSPEFVRVGKGVYRLNGGTEKVVAPQKVRRRREVSGLVRVVEELKAQYPHMAKRELLNELIRRRFDFRGKDPIRAMNMAWVRLGYSNSKSL